MKTLRFSLLLVPVSGLITNDWATLSDQTTLRLITPASYILSGDTEEIWQDMARNISCWVDEEESFHVTPPAGWDASLPLKVYTHGFSSSVTGEKTLFVPAWMERYGRAVNVLLVDWSNLAFFLQADNWDNYLYDSAARNAIDVGEFLGRCLAALTDKEGLEGGDIHLVGHSLGSHLMGKAGRVYQELQDTQASRITGLDPAGPRFVDGPILDALPELAENILTRESAAFVDVIHTNGAFEPAAVWVEPRCGLLQNLGHLDFYPSGGSVQPGCEFLGPDALPGGICSHRRATHYFLHSILEPHLFPALACSTIEKCNTQASNGDIVGYMGESSLEHFTGEEGLMYLEEGLRYQEEGLRYQVEGLRYLEKGLRYLDEGLRYLEVLDNHWTFREHGVE